jgi:hypothetical protein
LNAREYSVFARAGLHFLLPECRKIVDIIAEIIHVAAVSVRQHSPGKPLPAMVNNQHVKTHVEKVIGQLGIFDVTLNATRANHNDPIVFSARKRTKRTGTLPTPVNPASSR